jgi:hypothetical protein
MNGHGFQPTCQQSVAKNLQWWSSAAQSFYRERWFDISLPDIHTIPISCL